MKISTTQYFQQSVQQLGDLQSGMAKTQTQMTSGKKITKPSDEPDKAAVLARLQTGIARQENYQNGIKQANLRYSAEESALTSASDMVTRIKELATQAANGTMSAQDRKTLGLEISNLRDQLLSLGNSQDANGNYLFSGSRANQPAFGPDSTGQVRYQGDQNRMMVSIGDNRSIHLNRPGSDVFVRVVRTDAKGDKQGVDFFQVLDDLTKAVNGSDQIAMQRGLNEVDVLQSGISEGLGQVGADQAAADAQSGVLDQIILQFKSYKSDVEDLDYTEAVTRMNRDELALQAAQSSFAKISQLSLFKFLS